MYDKYYSIAKARSLLSQTYRLFAYAIEKPKLRLKNGMFIVSVDVDVGSKELAIVNEGNNDANVSSCFNEYVIGDMEEWALPLFINLFNHFELPVTFALRGQLTEIGHSVLGILLKSSIKHDIGAHGYYHKDFKSLSEKEAENELKMISVGMDRFGIVPRSFVFPRNSVAYLDLLEKYGYKCYRGGSLCLSIEKSKGLYNIRPSYFIDPTTSSEFLRMILDLCIAKKLPFHIWFHAWNWFIYRKFDKTRESARRSIYRLFFPLLEYAKQKEKTGALSFETMLSAAEKVDELRQ